MHRVADMAARLEELAQRPILVVTHKRSGTHLAMDFFRRQFAECDAWKWWGEGLSHLYLSLASLCEPVGRPALSEDSALRILRRCRRPMVKSHAFLDEWPVADTTGDGRLGRFWLDWLRDRARTLYVYRDGRAVMCSLRLLELRRDPSRKMSISEFIRSDTGDGTTPVESWARHVRRGLDLDDAVLLRFEDLLADPARSMAEMAQRFDLTARDRRPLLPARHRSIWRGRWARLFETRPQSSAILGRPKGEPLGRWQQTFTRDDREYFHGVAGDLLVRLGYEEDDCWLDSGRSPT